MPNRIEDRDVLRFKESMRSLGASLKEHPVAISAMALCFTFVVVAVIGLVLYLAHVEREQRQTWVETTFAERLDRNNAVLARIEAELSQIDVHEERAADLLRSARDALNANREEMRQLRIAVLSLKP